MLLERIESRDAHLRSRRAEEWRGLASKFPDLDLGRASQVKPRLGVDNEAEFSRGRPLRLLRSVQGTSWLATTRDFAPEVVEVIWDAARASPRTDPAPLRAL